MKYSSIVRYWSSREDECGLAVDWADADERCWRCGGRSKLEKCHIVPDSYGGQNSPDNIVLLCRRCHREAPNVVDPRFMWIWIRATCMPFCDSFWFARGLEEFNLMFGRPPFTGPDFTQEAIGKAQSYMKQHLDKAIIHFGEGRLNPSTIASILALAEESVTGDLPSAVNSSAVEYCFFRAAGMLRDFNHANQVADGNRRQVPRLPPNP